MAYRGAATFFDAGRKRMAAVKTWFAACLLMCCAVFSAAPACAATSAKPQNARQAPLQKSAKPGWDYQVPDRSAQHARWRESISATLQRTTFAPSAPAGRYLRHKDAKPGKRLPPVRLDELDALLPPEKKRNILGGNTPMHGEFAKERTGWRPYADHVGSDSVLREERRAGAYADFHPAEGVELKLGPEYYLGSSVLRPEQTGHSKDNASAFGMGMKLKIDF
jgi:hypothetical protein